MSRNVRRPIDVLLHKEFRFLINEAGFTVLHASQHEAELANGDIRISLRYNWKYGFDYKSGGFGILITREGELNRFYPLIDYADYFGGKRTRHVRDIPTLARQAEQLKEYLPRIVGMLQAPPDSEEWKAYDEFFTRW